VIGWLSTIMNEPEKNVNDNYLHLQKRVIYLELTATWLTLPAAYAHFSGLCELILANANDSH